MQIVMGALALVLVTAGLVGGLWIAGQIIAIILDRPSDDELFDNDNDYFTPGAY